MDPTLRKVINLFSKLLDEHHISVLSKGLKFCPTPNYPEPGQCREDLDNLHRRLRQIAHYDCPVDNVSFLASQINLTPEINDLNERPNLSSLEPFRHRKFKLKSTGTGPPAPLDLEAMVLCNELGFNTRSPDKPPIKKNLTDGGI